MSRRVVQVMLVVGAVLLLASCAAGANDVVNTSALAGGAPAGFWQGLWHGFISPIAFIVSLFKHDVGIYEIHNNGAWYNFGFVAGASMFFNGSAESGRGARRRSAKLS